MSFLEKIKQRTQFIKQRAFVSDEVQNQRIEICNSCEHLISLARNCSKCGCFVDAKTKLSRSKCPIDKWEAIVYRDQN